MSSSLYCAFCHRDLRYVHGHATCVYGTCPMFGLNQAECCSGEAGECLPTSAVAASPGEGILRFGEE